MLTLFPSGLSDLGCCHIPEAWAGLGPLEGPSWGWRSWGGCACHEPFPMDLVCLFPSALAHNLQIQAGPPAAKLHLLHPQDVEPLGWKSCEKPPGLHVSRWWGSHLQPPSLGSPHLWLKHPPQSGASGTGMCPGERGKGGRRNGTQALGVLARATLMDNPGTGFWFPR